MRTALVYSNQATIDFLEVRTSVIRIPEVVATIKEAQTTIDQVCPNPMDLMSFMISDDARFWANEKFRKLCVSLVQIALSRRYYKKNQQAEILVGADESQSTLNVMSGQQSLSEFVEACLFQIKTSNTFELATGVMPDKLKALILRDGVYESVELKETEVAGIIRELREDNAVARYINVGPCNTLVSSRADEVMFYDVQVEELINMDPMLSWFWPSLNSHLQDVAN